MQHEAWEQNINLKENFSHEFYFFSSIAKKGIMKIDQIKDVWREPAMKTDFMIFKVRFT